MPEAEEKGPEIQEEPEEGKLVEFPADAVRMPEPFLPRPVGRIDEGHPLKRWLVALLLIFLVVLIGHFLFLLIKGPPKPDVESNRSAFSETYREAGSITYLGKPLDGWFLEPSHEHFMAHDGRRFTYVQGHERGESQVSGYWRIVR
jgi:hypothetical protein